jgi:hypothetical protein
MTAKKYLAELDGKRLVSMCSWCKKIRDPYGEWIDPGVVFLKYFGGKFTHTICEQCYNLYFPDFTKEINESYQQVEIHKIKEATVIQVPRPQAASWRPVAVSK